MIIVTSFQAFIFTSIKLTLKKNVESPFTINLHKIQSKLFHVMLSFYKGILEILITITWVRKAQ